MLADMPNVHQKGLVFDVGVNDIKGLHGTPVYTHWKSMLMRCYSEKFKANHPAYKECSVCEEWKRLSVFKEWFDKNYQDDYDLEKDIISKGNKVYSPQTCCFVPRALNILITTDRRRQSLYPVGVHRCQWGNCVRYQAHFHHNNTTIHVGYFKTPEEAFYAYKSAKEQKVKEIATQYFQEGKITQRVYQALMEYQVEITD